ncbi:hypothetical protein AOB60_00390 [Streptomyces noursei]|uniref:Uncharacterized protein n=2 Tax=Streptomyces noursei TaxID=1971 RepID=A0A2N8PQY9_STRNR|nr:hypothetical protein AOB60_00390 [Streptomyces noursei]
MRWLGRGAVLVGVTGGLLVAVAGSAVAANDGGPQVLAADDGGLLGPFSNIKTSEGIPSSFYELTGGGDGISDTVMRFMASGMFALARLVAGGSCWLIDWIYRFPIIDRLASTSQHIADAYAKHIVTPLGLAGVFIAWSFAFGLFMVARGRAGRGLGEIVLTLLIAAISATSLVRPDVVLGQSGPLHQAQRAALEAAVITTHATDSSNDSTDPCSVMLGGAKDICERSGIPEKAKKAAAEKDKSRREELCKDMPGAARDVCVSGSRAPVPADVSQPISKTLTDILVVQPYQLLQYGRIIKKDSPLYKDYQTALVIGDGDPATHPCDKLDGKAGDLCRKRNKDISERCDDLPKPSMEDCRNVNGVGDAEGNGKAQKALLEQDGPEGKAAAAYMSSMTWDRVLGALFVLVAALVMAIVVIGMAFAMVAAQFSCVLAACATYVVFVWALLPGPNRMVLWRWVGVFASSTVVLFCVSEFIPLFGIAARTLLGSEDTALIERLVLLDALAVTAVVLHRRMVAKGSSLGHAFASWMRFAKVGGTHMMGDQAAGMGMALTALGSGGRGGGGVAPSASVSLARSGASPAHAALAMRRAKLASGMAALSDTAGLPGNPMSALGEARAEARRAVAPLSVPLRAAQLAWVGPPREPNWRESAAGSGPRGLGGVRDGADARNGARSGQLAFDPRTGEILSEPPNEVRPVGQRLRERISRTRGGRVLLGAARIAWHSTVGLPAGWERLHRRRSDLTKEMYRQLEHYTKVREGWGSLSRNGMRRITRGRSDRVQSWAKSRGASLRNHLRRGRRLP